MCFPYSKNFHHQNMIICYNKKKDCNTKIGLNNNVIHFYFECFVTCVNQF